MQYNLRKIDLQGLFEQYFVQLRVLSFLKAFYSGNLSNKKTLMFGFSTLNLQLFPKRIAEEIMTFFFLCLQYEKVQYRIHITMVLSQYRIAQYTICPQTFGHRVYIIESHSIALYKISQHSVVLNNIVQQHSMQYSLLHANINTCLFVPLILICHK